MTRHRSGRAALGAARAGVVLATLVVGTAGLAACSTGPAPADEPEAAMRASSASATATPGSPGSEHRARDRAPVPGRRSAGPGEPTVGPHHEQSDVLRRLPGRADGGCVPVGDRRDVRSGGLAAGPFDTARAGYSPAYGNAQVIRLYLVPEHAATMPGLTVTARREGGGEVVRQRQAQTADADLFRFYDLGLAIPRAGTWVIRAAAGQDQGCWILALR